MYCGVCACVWEWDEPYVKRDVRTIQLCRTHNTYSECLTHNHTFGTRTPEDQDKEKAKPQFQRR